jgi:hypothetical protein
MHLIGRYHPSGFCWILPLAVTHADFVANDPAAYLRLEKDALFYALRLELPMKPAVESYSV